ncbi:MAG: tetratricopeptide repeat protein [Saprospiraceae bacterium]|nr:tetratricopeptide repeat protein [Saprospiraceae bacterium]
MKLSHLWLLLIAVIAASCSSQDPMQKEIAALEQEVQENPEVDKAEELLELYQEYIIRYPENDDVNSRYLYRAAELQFRLNRISESIETLKQALRHHYEAENTLNNALLLGALYNDRVDNQVLAQTVFQATTIAFPNSEKAKQLTEEGLQPLDQRLQEMGKRVFNDSTGQINYRAANNFINGCAIHALILPGDEDTPDWLYKAAETSRSLRNYERGLQLYEWVFSEYPYHDRAAQALFLYAFTLDNDMERYQEAEVAYNRFLEQYPDSDFADDAKFLLDNIGKDEEEIIRSFEERGSSDES